MKFKIPRRQGRFGKFNPRNEKHGTENVAAADLSVTFTGGKRDFDMLFPHPTMKLSDVIWVDKRMALPFVKLTNARTPENVAVTLYDQATNKRKPLQFEGCKIKVNDVVIKEKNTFDAKLIIQLHDDPEEHSARLRALMDTEREFELEAQQEDFFGQDDDEDEEEGQQSDMVGDDQPEDDTDDEDEDSDDVDDDEDAEDPEDDEDD